MRNCSSKFKLSAFILQLLSFIFISLIFNLSPSTPASDMDQAIIHYNQGYDYYKKGEYDRAIEELKNSLKFDPGNENAYYGLGNCYYRKQMYEKAVESYKKAIEINPDFSNAHYGLGTAYSALRKTDEADKEFTIYRKLKSGLGQTKGAVATTDKSKKKPSAREERKSRKPSIKSRQIEKKKGFKSLSPKKKIKNILTVPRAIPPQDYIKVFAETWDNSYIGKVLIGIIGFVGITQAWLLLVAFQGVLLWRMRGKKTQD